MLEIAAAWQTVYPGACLGMMVVDKVANPRYNLRLEEKKTKVVQFLQAEFGYSDLVDQCQSLQPYIRYYKRYKKNYHVLHQLESIIYKGKQLPCAAALVEAMFLAELKNCLLTAGHDLAAIQEPLHLGLAGGHERYTGINGKEQLCKKDDMMLADKHGIISSILGGPDARTSITPCTKQALFVVYGPVGITPTAINNHLHDIFENIKLITAEACITFLEVYPKNLDLAL
ncbi:phenylalanine--tRNA ligase beta subunit-related protein [Sporomusa sp.]|uniref:phenylalanine--tRNA ligase beta subunit-related protein n=1 Tax=Sporomusa sp. TaxID=2078658 RepID=UPI002C46E65E|nr:phenylalanine--tRNA ligase beta subunit-related protein [Sporomusa sp.]HWR08367.1 phenylalanine--tRNA ligase beta subunit-related protein [Sporomusa sp.]